MAKKKIEKKKYLAAHAGTGSRLSDKDAQRLGEHFETLRSRHGRLSADLVVRDAAKNPASPVREWLTWDDKVAAHKQRVSEAAYLLRNVQEIVHLASGDYQLRSFQSVDVEGPGRTVEYERATDVMSDPALRAQIVARGLSEAKSWVARYEPYEELVAITKAIKSVVGKQEKKKKVA